MLHKVMKVRISKGQLGPSQSNIAGVSMSLAGIVTTLVQLGNLKIFYFFFFCFVNSANHHFCEENAGDVQY